MAAWEGAREAAHTSPPVCRAAKGGTTDQGLGDTSISPCSPVEEREGVNTNWASFPVKNG